MTSNSDTVDIRGWILIRNRSEWLKWVVAESLNTQNMPENYPCLAKSDVDGSQWSYGTYLYAADVAAMTEALSPHN